MGDKEALSLVAGRARRHETPSRTVGQFGVDDSVDAPPSGEQPRPPETRRLWILLSAAVLAVAGAFAVRAYRAQRAREAALAEATRAMARDTYGGYRDVDRALRDFVGPHSEDVQLVSMRSYALAELAARYGDDQAAVDSELLNAPIERRMQEKHPAEPPPRFYAARALLLVAGGEPGSALLALSGAPQDRGSSELDVVRAQILLGLEKPREAEAALQDALRDFPTSLEVLRAAASEARRAHDNARALEISERALAQNPSHWPSLILIAALALEGKQPASLAHAHDLLEGARPSLPTEASAGEQCDALLDLAQLDLALGDIAEVVQILDRTAEIDDAPPGCRAGLARIDQRLGRDDQALTLLRLATDDDETGDATLAFAEAARDPTVVARELATHPPGDLSAANTARWEARRDADRLVAAVSSGRANEAQALGRKLEGWDIPQVLCALARLQSAAGDTRAAGRLIDRAVTAAMRGPDAGDTATWVGLQALTVQDYSGAVRACSEGARLAAGNYRALVCEARALLALRRGPEALAASERALAIDPSGAAALQVRAKSQP